MQLPYAQQVANCATMAERSTAEYRSLIITPPPSVLEVDDVGGLSLLCHLSLTKSAYYLQCRLDVSRYRPVIQLVAQAYHVHFKDLPIPPLSPLVSLSGNGRTEEGMIMPARE